jgi:hypothetical protein
MRIELEEKVIALLKPRSSSKQGKKKTSIWKEKKNLMKKRTYLESKYFSLSIFDYCLSY